jgi:hypothetical protein
LAAAKWNIEILLYEELRKSDELDVKLLEELESLKRQVQLDEVLK